VPYEPPAAADACARKISVWLEYANHSQPIKAGPANAQGCAGFGGGCPMTL